MLSSATVEILCEYIRHQDEIQALAITRLTQWREPAFKLAGIAHTAGISTMDWVELAGFSDTYVIFAYQTENVTSTITMPLKLLFMTDREWQSFVDSDFKMGGTYTYLTNI